MMLQQMKLCLAWVHLGYIKYIGICGALLACSKVDHLTPVVNTTTPAFVLTRLEEDRLGETKLNNLLT